MEYAIMEVGHMVPCPEQKGWDMPYGTALPLITKTKWAESGQVVWIMAARGGVTAISWADEGLVRAAEYFLELDFPTQISAEIFLRGMEVPEDFDALIKIGFVLLPPL